MFSVVAKKSRAFFRFSYSANQQVCRSLEEPSFLWVLQNSWKSMGSVITARGLPM